MTPSADDDRFRTAARIYLVYAVFYEVGGVYLVTQGVGVPPAASRALYAALWAALGLIPLLGVPYLLRRPRAWFERWVLGRRDFARVLVLLMAFRAFKVAEVAVRRQTAIVAAPWGGEISFRAGALVFFAVTVAALAVIARAAWHAEARP